MTSAATNAYCSAAGCTFTSRRPSRSSHALPSPRVRSRRQHTPRARSLEKHELAQIGKLLPQTLSRTAGRVPAVQASGVSHAVKSTDSIRVVLPTREAQQSVKFALARIGTENAVVISRLVGGSAASEAGVRAGQRLLAISDPMRGGDSTLWHLNDRPSMRFVRDALSMRQGDSITFMLSRDSAFAEVKPSMQSIDVPAEPAATQSGFDMSLFGDEEETATPASPAESSSGGGGGQTVGERLEAKWVQDQQRGQEQQSAFQRRQQKRREYFEKESGRDNGKLVLIVAAVVLLPAVAILTGAYLSGYLDRLNDSYTTYR